jgi:hypothetical protein
LCCTLVAAAGQNIDSIVHTLDHGVATVGNNRPIVCNFDLWCRAAGGERDCDQRQLGVWCSLVHGPQLHLRRCAGHPVGTQTGPQPAIREVDFCVRVVQFR